MLTTTLSLLYKPFLETLWMVVASGIIATVLGALLGGIVFATSHPALWPNKLLNKLLSLIINGVRSIPYIILMVLLIPITRQIVGTSIGTQAAIVSLSVGAMPFVARLVETALKEVGPHLIETAQSLGATPLQILCQFLFPEALPAMIDGITLTLINLVGYSAMAGAIGGGGLGDLAIRYGYQRFEIDVMLMTVVALILLVQAIQWLGHTLARRVDKR